MRVLMLAMLSGCSEYGFIGSLETNDLGEPERTGEIGDGNIADAEVAVERFVVSDRTDVLFFGDTSASMAAELQTMADHAQQFGARLDAFDTDWQLLAVTGPSGCSEHGVLTRDTPGWRQKFAADLMRPPGEDLVDEWGLYSAMVAVENSAWHRCNAGFVRSDALLHVIFISDEDDNSPGYETGRDYWRGYVEAIRAARGDNANVRFSAVGGPVPEACDGAEPGTGYWEAVRATEGAFLSICDDWSTEIEELATDSLTQRYFTLAEEADPATIEITIDGVDRPQGWTWLPETLQVRFDIGAPIANQAVEIAYVAM